MVIDIEYELDSIDNNLKDILEKEYKCENCSENIIVNNMERNFTGEYVLDENYSYQEYFLKVEVECKKCKNIEIVNYLM